MAYVIKGNRILTDQEAWYENVGCLIGGGCLVIIVIGLLFLLGGAAMLSDSGDSSQTQDGQTQQVYDDSQQSYGGSQQSNGSATYHGKIGKSYVTMVLNPYVGEDEVAGSYVYNNSSVTTEFTLVVRERTGNRLLITEHRPSDGFQSGTFEGDLSNGGGTYTGYFYNSQGKEYTFALYRD